MTYHSRRELNGTVAIAVPDRPARLHIF